LSENRNDPDARLTAARQAVHIAPRSAAAYQALAQALQGQNKQDEAAAAVRQAQELSKQPVEADVIQASRYALKRSAVIARASDTAGTAGATPTASFEDATRLAD